MKQEFVHVSGQVSWASDGSIVGKGDMRAQSEQVFKLNGYLVNMNAEAVAAYREVRARFLKPGQFPASTLVGVTRLVQDDLLLEVEVVAAVDGTKSARKAKKKKS